MAMRENSVDNTLVSGTSSADSIVNGYRYYDYSDISHHYSGFRVTIDAGKGNDTIFNGVSNVSIDGGAGNDYIDNEFGFRLFGLSTRYLPSYVPTSDQISKPDNSTLIGGDGNDSILNNGANVTITGGAGADSIVNGSRYEIYPASSVKIDGGAGNDSIFNGKGSYEDKYHQYGGDSLTIDGGAGDDYIQTRDGGEYSSIIGGKGNDSILNGSDNTAGHAAKYLTISGGEGNDSVFNNGENVTIDGGQGDDTVYNWAGNNSSINGGAGNDSIYNWGGFNVSINAGSGNDYIYNWSGSNVSINGGSGNDSIVSRSNNDTLCGGAGNDLISLVSSSHLIQYANGEGNDTIYGFNESDTLTISGGSYSTTTSGSDVIVNVGKGKVLLVGANGKNLNINKTGTTKLITLTDDADYFENNLAGVKISGKDGNDTIVNDYFWNYKTQKSEYQDKVTIDGGAGNDSIISEGGNKFSINGGDGDDTIENLEGKNGKIFGGAGNDEIHNEGNSNKIFGGEGNDYISNEYGKKVTIDSGAGNDGIYNEIANSVSINSGSGNDYIYNFLGDRLTINAGDGDDTIYNRDGSWLVYQYADGDGDDSIKSGIYTSLTLSITGGYSSLKSGSDVIVTVGEGKITLVGAASLSSVNIVNEVNPRLVVGSKSNDSLSQTLASATIKALDGDDSVTNCGANVSLFGGKGNDTIYNNTSYTEIKERTVNQYQKVDVPDYDWVDETIMASMRLVQLNASIKSTEADITEAERKRKNAEDAHDDEMEKYYAGNKSNYEGVLKDFQDNYAEIDKKIKVLGDYVMYTGNKIREQVGSHKVDSLVGTTTETYSVTHQTNNTGTTISGGEGDDYIINSAKNFVYSYTVGDGNDTISGFNAASKLRISGGDYTASASGNDVILKIGDGSITLKDTKGMILNINDEKAFKPAWTLNKTTATYGSAVETLISVDGVKSLDGLSLKKNVVTVSDASLNKKRITVSDGYTLKLGSDVTKTSTTKAWSLKNTTATYKQTTTAGYTLADNAINYSKKSVETLATVKGVKSTDGLGLKKNVVTVSDASLNKKKVTISGDGYSLKLASDVSKSKNQKAAWSLSGTTATYKSAYKTAGYTLASDKKSIAYSAATKASALATIKGAKSTKGLSVSDEKITLKNSALSKNVTVSGGYEFDFASDYKQATITGSKNSDTITARGSKVSINAGAGNDTIKLFGSANTVAGGKGNDSLWGDAGSNTFVYKYVEGKDIIFGFDNNDTLTLDGLDFKASYKNDILTLKVSDGSITLKNFSATTFHINSDTYKISGSKLVK